MLDRQQLERALALNDMGRHFMKWLGELDRDARVAYDESHVRMSVPDATRAWVERNYLTIPQSCRPAREDLASFGNLVGTYLETSFDLVPGRKFVAGCGCDACATFRDVSSLKAKQLTRHDREDARRLARTYLRDRADGLGVAVTDLTLDAVAARPELREPLAMAAWARELLLRLDGEAKGPVVLALWRTFAWNTTGSPKQGFTITADAILEADETVVAAIRSAAA